ncbi:MAG: hypothetical protein RIC55_22985 [Pirellulaceae bacterium]
MPPAVEYLRSVEWIWPLWLVSASVVGAMTVVGVARLSLAELRRLWRCEKGAAYSLSYVMVVPFYLIFVCLVIESTHILVAKIGTVYSAYAGARAGIVWYSSTTPGDAKSRVVEAAQQAFVPFASGTGPDQQNVTENNASYRHRQYMKAYRRFVDDPAAARYVMAKYDYTEQALEVTDDVAGARPAKWDDDITVEVKYRFRFNVPIIAQIIGTRGADGHYYYNIVSRIALQSEAPMNDKQELGISYASPN